MTKKNKKIGCLPIIVALILIGGIGNLFSNNSSNIEIPNSSNTTETMSEISSEVVSESNTEPEKEIIYEENEPINDFLLNYNEMNAEKIDATMFSIYRHHGSDHKNQIIFENKNNFEVVITNSYGRNIKVVILRRSDVMVSDTDFQQEFIKFGKAFNNNLTDEDLLAYWSQVDDFKKIVEFNEFELYKEEYMIVLDNRYVKK